MAPVAMINASHVYSPTSPIRRNGRSASLTAMDVIEDQFGRETLRMLLESRHEVGSHDAVGVGGPVVDVGRRHQLAALRETGDQHGREVGARGVYCGAVTGRAGAQDHQAGMLGWTFHSRK